MQHFWLFSVNVDKRNVLTDDGILKMLWDELLLFH